MCGGYNIREVAAVVEQLDLLITPDSGLLHYGGHFRIPTVSIWGGTDPNTRIKYYPTVVAIIGKEKCERWPCFLHAPACEFGVPAPCIDQIHAEEVVKVIDQLGIR